MRRGYFNCAKSYPMLERGGNVSLSHCALTYLLTLWGNLGWDKG